MRDCGGQRAIESSTGCQKAFYERQADVAAGVMSLNDRHLDEISAGCHINEPGLVNDNGFDQRLGVEVSAGNADDAGLSRRTGNRKLGFLQRANADASGDGCGQ